MKRMLTLTLALALALCLLCGGMAMAEGEDTGTNPTLTGTDKTTIDQDSEKQSADTTVSYTIENCEDYTVTIPGSVTLTGTDNLSGMIAIELDTTAFNVPGKTITVKLSNAAFKLLSDEREIQYTIKAAGKEYSMGDAVLSWTYGDGTSMTQALVVGATVSSNLPAGVYKDTLTFAVSVTDPNAAASDITDD